MRNNVIGTVHASPEKIYGSMRWHIEHTPEVLKRVKEKYELSYEEIDERLNKLAQYESEDLIKEAAESKRELIKKAEVVYFETEVTNKSIIDMQLFLISKEENKRIKFLDGKNKKYGEEKKSIKDLVEEHSMLMAQLGQLITEEQHEAREKLDPHLLYNSVYHFIKGNYKAMCEDLDNHTFGGLPMTEEQREVREKAEEVLGRRDKYWKITENEGVLVIAGAAHEEYVRTELLGPKEKSKLESRMAEFFGDDF